MNAYVCVVAHLKQSAGNEMTCSIPGVLRVLESDQELLKSDKPNVTLVCSHTWFERRAKEISARSSRLINQFCLGCAVCTHCKIG